jgi:glycosyltransferase involved in cell wall biosynthesis
MFLLIEGLRKRGWRNLLVCPPRSGCAVEARGRRIETQTIPMRSDLDVTALWRLTRLLRKLGPDLVHLHTGRATWLGGIAARLAGVPAIATRRMDRPIQRGWRSRWIYQRLVRHVVAISPAVGRCLEEAGIPADRRTIIPSAVDPDRTTAQRSRESVRASLGTPGDEPVLLVVCALVRRKGVDVLLQAMLCLEEEGLRPVLWIAGDGPERRALEDQAQRLGVTDRVRFLGSRPDVGDLLGACDVFVLASRREGLGVAALEAMAAGRPVVASAVGGLCDAVVEGRTGLLVPPDDAPALSGAVARLLRDDDLRSALGAAGPQRIREGFLAEPMVTSYTRLYEQVLKESR